MSSKAKWFLILTAFILNACKVDDPSGDLVIEVDDDFQLTMLEDLTTPEDDLHFKFESIRSKACDQDTVLIDLDNFGTALIMNINVQSTASNCQVTDQKAVTQTLSGELTQDNVSVSIKFTNVVANQGNLLLDNDSYELKMETSYGFYVAYETLRKVPRNSIWGYIGFTPNLSNIAQSLIQDIEDQSSSIDLTSGNYGYFDVSADKDIKILDQEQEVVSTRPFVRNYGTVADLQVITSIIQDYKERYPNLRLNIRDSFGNIIAE